MFTAHMGTTSYKKQPHNYGHRHRDTPLHDIQPQKRVQHKFSKLTSCHKKTPFTIWTNHSNNKKTMQDPTNIQNNMRFLDNFFGKNHIFV